MTLRISILSFFEHYIPNFKVMAIAAAALVSALAFILMAQFVMWYLALAILAVWSPLAFRTFYTYMLANNKMMAVYFVFVALQSIHMSEHVAQEIQIHLLGRPPSMSHGILGGPVFDTEVLHYLFDSWWIPMNTVLLLVMLRGRERWLWLMLPLVCWHAAEHYVIMVDYWRTGITGTPGLLAAGGHIHWFVSVSRPDLHFLYNLLETVPMLFGFLSQRVQAEKGNING
jgi:hypothetical protein